MKYMKQKLSLTFFLSFSFFLSAQNNPLINKEINEENNKKFEKILIELSVLESDNFLFSLKSAQYFSQKNQLDSAALYIEKAINQYKYLPISHDSERFLTIKDSLYKSSIFIYDKIISINPTDWNYCNRGVLKKDIGLYRESILDFSKAIEIDSLDFLNYYNRGMAYSKLNLIDKAISDYVKCIQLNPDYSSAYLNKGYALMSKNDYKGAIEEFEIALSKRIGFKEKGYTMNNIGFAYYKLKDYETSRSFINKSLEIYPINSYAYKNLALIDIAINEKDNACKNILKSIELGFVNQFGNEIIELQKNNCY